MKALEQPGPSKFGEESVERLDGSRRWPTAELMGPSAQAPQTKLGSHRRAPRELAKIDLNLLRILDVVLEERSVTRASARLDLTQSAVSHALSRLRRELGDELFRRSAEGLLPTPRALEIAPGLHAALSQMRRALSPVAFDPALSDQTFNLVVDYGACAMFIPAVVVRMRALAPNARLHVSENSAGLAQRLDARDVDFALGVVSSAPERFVREQLAQEELVWIVRPGHPLTQGKATLEAIAATPHVVVSGRRTAHEASMVAMGAGWEDLAVVDAELARRGLQRRVSVVTPDIFSARDIVSCSDMATLAPRRLARAWAHNDTISLVEPHERLSAVMTLLYRKDRLVEPPVAWMGDLLRTL
jgi:DNA-binding transcriptional LysR family regulator